MYAHIGDIIKKLRIEKNISIQDIAIYSNYSTDYIYKIERGIRKPSIDLLYLLSTYLNFDFITIDDNLDLFKNYEHYFLCYNLIEHIENNDFECIENLLKSPIVQNEFTYNETLIIKNYSTLLVEIYINKNYSYAITLCLKELNIELNEVCSFIPKLHQNKYYYKTIILLIFCFNKNKNFDTLLCFQKNVIYFLESTYFNNVIPIYSIKLFYKEFYITMLNNYIDTLLNTQNYDLALTFCDKAIIFSKENHIYHDLLSLLKLKIQILYNLNKINESKYMYNNLISLCNILNDEDYIEKLNIIIKKHCPLIYEI